MPWAVAGAAIAAGGAIYAANKQSGAAKDAANASNAATQANIAEQQREFNINQQNLEPWLNTGKSALNVLAGMYGLNSGSQSTGATQTLFDGTKATPINGGIAGSQPNYSAFFQSPDYQFALQQGQGALDRDAAARGTLYGGAHTADAIKFGQGLASQQFGNYYNRLAGLAGIGQQTGTQLGYMGQSTANQIGNANEWNAQNQMNSSYNQANAYSNLAGQLGNAGGQLAGYMLNRPQTTNYLGGGTYTGPSAVQDYSQFSNPDVSSFYGGGFA